MKSKLHHSSNGPRGNLVCILDVHSAPFRLPRDEAARLVAKGTHTYCKKKIWREHRKADVQATAA